MSSAGMWTQIDPFWVQDPKKDDVAYSGIYTYALCKRMGWLFSYIDVSGLDIQSVLHDALQTDYRKYIENGHPHYVSGCTMAEFAKYILMDRLHLQLKNTEQASTISDAYWSGWYITMFQWMYNIPWDDIEKYCKVDMVRDRIFPVGHTMNDTRIFEAFILRVNEAGYKREFKDPLERIKELNRISDETEERVKKEFEAEETKG